MEEQKERWFAMSAPYNNELKVQEALAGFGIRCFIAMRSEMVEINGKKQKKSWPAVSNLVFVRAEEKMLNEVKPRIARLQYKMVPDGSGKSRKLVVPDDQMAAFIKFLESNYTMEFLPPDETALRVGERVQISGGPLKGLEGVVASLPEGKSRQVALVLDKLVAVAVKMPARFVVPQEQKV